MRIGVDLMGSDNSPSSLFHAVLIAAEQLESQVTLIVLATSSVVHELWSNPHLSQKLQQASARVEFHVVQESIEMNDEPLIAIRHKKNSSLVTGIRLLKKRYLDAFVSAGNTGALIASATLSLPLLPDIKRPALLATLPTETGSVAVIDVGGNVSCKAQHLVQFAQMGAAYQRCLGVLKPKIGLLNIGVESKKGTSEVRQAYQVLQEKMAGLPEEEQAMQFLGNIEGRDVFRGKVDVLVTDGFTGNVLLKTSEGVSAFIFDLFRETVQDKLPKHIIEHFHSLYRHFNYDEYPGAIICGIERVVIKCHGQSSSRGMLNAIKGAVRLVSSQFIQQIKENF